jgi:hypothetical protein
MDLPLRCRCGAWRGVLRAAAPRSGNRVVCYCDDCQAFAHWLGDARGVLDAAGGTDIFQTSPARVEITAGGEQLACMRLRPGSNVLRWFARCCRTPIGNTPADPRFVLVGVIHACMDFGTAGRSADAVLGPIRGSAFPEFARGDRAELPRKVGVRHLARLVRIILAARLRGDVRRSPFDLTRVKPQVLGASPE